MFQLKETVAPKRKPQKLSDYPYDPLFPQHIDFVGEPWEILSKHIGQVEKGGLYNFWTFGRYCMTDIINHLLRITGPAEVTATTWSLNAASVQTMLNRRKDGLLTSFRMWIDPRVRRAAPEPLALLRHNFETVIAPVHAKIALIGNDEWKISVSGSVNFTSNPQPERGIIQCIDSVYDRDKTIIDAEFAKGDRYKLSDCEKGDLDDE
ncbi:MAG: hypothetical protein K6G79_04170 [Bacteroidales bacterium]|nr:hypothetical protein [Bacteroidales bacterium]